ncbi:MAG: aminoacyl-tRNA hydrolase [Bacteroidetes bacterium]|nr:MAG: aminoacyl-tRNA hydrolase [Bacteroidota bacterium]
MERKALAAALIGEVQYRMSRSSGPGGQHVNKTESRVSLLWFPARSGCLTEARKQLIRARLGSRLTTTGALQLNSGASPSQFRNKAKLNRRFLDLIEEALKPVKKRQATRPGRSSTEKRLKAKKRRSKLKKDRRGGNWEV